MFGFHFQQQLGPWVDYWFCKLGQIIYMCIYIYDIQALLITFLVEKNKMYKG
jgi:hypothetical protein